MKRVGTWVALLAVVASLVFIGSLLSSTPVSAQAHSQSFAEDQEGYYPTPPQSRSDCEARGGEWNSSNHCHGNWEGMDKWNEFIASELNITDTDSCQAAGGTAIRDSSGFLNLGSVYKHCIDFENYERYVQVARNTPLDPNNENTPPRTDDPRSIIEGEDEDDSGADGVARECNAGAIGWIICPIANTLAEVVDGIYKVLVEFVKMPAIQSGTDSAIYRVWQIFRNMANIVFVLMLLIALVSQISNLGMNNYGIKRLLPRIIVSAVLVNISFFICQIAVDLSNIIGQSLYNLLTSIAQSLPLGAVGGGADGEGYTPGMQIWVAAISSILSLGAIGGAAAGGAAAVITAMGAGGGMALVWIAVPVVLMAAVAVLTAFAILALRYILIYVLIAIAPLAFVAYLLPNTYKYFDKWRDIFVVILMFYPLFSLLFGMSQVISVIVLASAPDAANASDSTGGFMGAVMVLFALFIQVAPLFMSYKLLQTANSLAGTLTNGVQKQGTGLINRAKGKRNDTVGKAFGAGKNRLVSSSMNSENSKGIRRFKPTNALGRAITKKRLKEQNLNNMRQTWDNEAQSAQIYSTSKDAYSQGLDDRLRASSTGLSEAKSISQSDYVKRLADERGLAERAAGSYYWSAEEKDESMIKSVTRQARAQQSAEERKSYTAEFSGSAMKDLENALATAMQSGNVNKSQALQSLLYTYGGAGVSAVKKQIESARGSGMPADSPIIEGMRENIRANHGDMKSRDNAQMEWAIHGGDLGSIAKQSNFGANLSDKDKATQSVENLRAMANNGSLTPDAAKRILDNPNMSTGLKDDPRAILEAVSQGRAVPSDDDLKAARASAANAIANADNSTNVQNNSSHTSIQQPSSTSSITNNTVTNNSTQSSPSSSSNVDSTTNTSNITTNNINNINKNNTNTTSVQPSAPSPINTPKSNIASPGQSHIIRDHRPPSQGPQPPNTPRGSSD